MDRYEVKMLGVFICFNLVLYPSKQILDHYSDNVSPALLVKHYDCQERKYLQRFNLVAVEEYIKSTSQAEHNNR